MNLYCEERNGQESKPHMSSVVLSNLFWVCQSDHGFVKSVEALSQLLSKKHLLQARLQTQALRSVEQFKATSIA